MKHIIPPVAWQNFGEWALTGQHGMRPIYLSVMRGKLCARDATTDRRVALEPSHPVAQEIAHAINCHNEILSALITAESALSCLRASYENMGEYFDGYASRALPAVRSAIAKAESLNL